MRVLKWILLLGLVVASVGWQQDEVILPRIEKTDCDFRSPVRAETDCGVLIVPADYDDLSAGTMRLPYIIFKSTSANPRPDPIVLPVGGPGGEAVEFPRFTFVPGYYPFLEERDFILYDQRGVGEAVPSLDCPDLLERGYRILSEPHTPEELAMLEADGLINCRENDLADIDLRLFTTSASAADLNALRVALGYDEWNILGVSYGSKLALVSMRDFPEGIRSVILDSNVPMQSHLWRDLPFTRSRAFRLLFDTCAADAECSAEYPDLETTFYTAVEQMNAEPVLVEGLNRGRSSYDVYVNGGLFADTIFGMLYRASEIPEIPRMIAGIAQGDKGALALVAQIYLESPFGISEGYYYAIQCDGDALFTPEADALAGSDLLNPADQVNFEWSVRSVYAVCASFTTGNIDPADNLPISSDIPALVVSGQFDPITPPEWGRMIAEGLSNSFVYEFPGVGHGVVRSNDCARQVATNFLNNPTITPDSSCIDSLTPPKFVLP